jgi:2-phospho-L-lactate guanylyltransferase (CobY/MobA/RfbA family)
VLNADQARTLELAGALALTAYSSEETSLIIVHSDLPILRFEDVDQAGSIYGHATDVRKSSVGVVNAPDAPLLVRYQLGRMSHVRLAFRWLIAATRKD